MEWEGHVTRMEEMKIAYKILLGVSKDRISLESPRRIYEDNI
jgi:hypothetical protein